MKVRKAVIPAAGLGTRMLPATKTVPKEMLPMVDKPVIQYIIEEAVAAGIEDILIVTNRAKSAMDDYFDYYPELETRLLQAGKESELVEVRRAADLANIFYVRQKETKGLGHAIGRARRFVGDEPFAARFRYGGRGPCRGMPAGSCGPDFSPARAGRERSAKSGLPLSRPAQSGGCRLRPPPHTSLRSRPGS